MGLLISRVWAALFSSTEMKVVMVGLNNAGKTTILYQLMLGETVETSPTIGSNVEEVQFKNIKFAIWDIGGQESLRATWASYYQGAVAVIFVVDATDRDRLPVSKKELYNMLVADRLQNAKLLVFANKQDLRNAMTAAEVSEFLGLVQIKDRDWHIQACVATTGQGLQEGLEWLAQRLGGR